jgi:hypothetical protein
MIKGLPCLIHSAEGSINLNDGLRDLFSHFLGIPLIEPRPAGDEGGPNVPQDLRGSEAAAKSTVNGLRGRIVMDRTSMTDNGHG